MRKEFDSVFVNPWGGFLRSFNQGFDRRFGQQNHVDLFELDIVQPHHKRDSFRENFGYSFRLLCYSTSCCCCFCHFNLKGMTFELSNLSIILNLATAVKIICLFIFRSRPALQRRNLLSLFDRLFWRRGPVHGLPAGRRQRGQGLQLSTAPP